MILMLSRRKSPPDLKTALWAIRKPLCQQIVSGIFPHFILIVCSLQLREASEEDKLNDSLSPSIESLEADETR